MMSGRLLADRADVELNNTHGVNVSVASVRWSADPDFKFFSSTLLGDLVAGLATNTARLQRFGHGRHQLAFVSRPGRRFLNPARTGADDIVIANNGSETLGGSRAMTP
jgi:hypothetical protein